jgi:hypothetical protein
MHLTLILALLAAALLCRSCSARDALANDHCPCEETKQKKDQPGNDRPISSAGHNMCVLFDKRCLADEAQRTLVSEARETLSNANETIPIDIFLVDDPFSLNEEKSETNIADATLKLCNVILRVLPSSDYETQRAKRTLCPGQCFPTPEIWAPITWLLTPTITPQLLRQSSKIIEGGAVSKDKGGSIKMTLAQGFREDAPLTCSLSLHQYMHMSYTHAHGNMHGSSNTAAVSSTAPTSLNYLLIILYWRRIMECREESHWMAAYNSFQEKLSEYIAVEAQYNNHLLSRATGAEHRRLQDGMTLKQWSESLKSGGSTGAGVAGKGTAKGKKKGGGKHSGKGRGGASAGSGSSSTILGGRRKVDSVVIWVGSESSHQLMEDQARMLDGQPHNGNTAVIGWAADDRLYGCAEGTMSCPGTVRGNSRFHPVLPGSNINSMPEGWRCAQRRPLRALAHTLLLYDPQFIMLVDDDTYVNYPLLMKRYNNLLHNDLQHAPIVIGEFVGVEGEKGHVTKKGLLVGGSGYIIGKSLLTHLVEKEVWAIGGLGIQGGLTSDDAKNKYNFHGDPYRSLLQFEKLSVLADAIEQSELKCQNNNEQTTKIFNYGTASTNDKCVPGLVPHSSITSKHKSRSVASAIDGDTLNLNEWIFPQSSIIAQREADNRAILEGSSSLKRYNFNTMMVPIESRLIDLCANLMSNEGTCQHSDHAMGRCLFHGAPGIPIGAVCHSQVPFESIPNENKATGESLVIGMCFMSTECDVNNMITCHRFKPNSKSEYLKALDGNITSNKLKELTGSSLANYIGGEPLKIQKSRGYYKNYSSFWNGTHTDTNDIYSR